MPQIFLVLKCYKCLVFQVHQSKKTNKFVCKMCGEKQSIKRHYGIGNGQECRIHVQKLNGIRGEIDESKPFGSTASSDEDDDFPLPVKPKVINHSKWTDFVEKDETTEITNEVNDKIFLEDTEVVLEVPKKKRQKRFGDSHKHFKGKQQTESVEIVKQEIELDRQDLSYGQPHDVVNIVPTAYRRDKYQKIDCFTATNSKKIQFDSDNVENIDVNSFSQNIPKDLKTTNNPIKFKPPLLNPNSKWAKFTEYETNEEAIEEQPSPNLIEPHDSEGDDTLEIGNAQSNLYYSNEIISKSELPTILNHDEINALEPTDSESLEPEQYVEDKKKVFYPINKDKTGANHSQKDLKGLFSLCNDNEIDDFLDI